MPYAFETHKINLPVGKDRRVKLSPEQKQAIFKSPATISDRALAKEYGVNRRTIGFIRRPETLAANKLAREKRGGWKQYYDKDKHTDAIREHRRYKQTVILQENAKTTSDI